MRITIKTSPNLTEPNCQHCKKKKKKNRTKKVRKKKKKRNRNLLNQIEKIEKKKKKNSVLKKLCITINDEAKHERTFISN